MACTNRIRARLSLVRSSIFGFSPTKMNILLATLTSLFLECPDRFQSRFPFDIYLFRNTFGFVNLLDNLPKYMVIFIGHRFVKL